MELTGRAVLLTGGSRGIGRALARELADRGAELVLSSRGGDALATAARETDADAVAADLSRGDEADRLAGRARDLLGRTPDVVVHNAGVFRLAPAHRTPPEVFARHLAVNLEAGFRLVRAFLPGMLERGEGRLVHMGSQAGRQALPGNAAYSASKYGLRGLHEVLAVELEGRGVHSLLVEPGPVDTGAWDPLEDRLGDDLPARGQMLRPAEVAVAVADAVEREPPPGVLPLSPSA